MLSRSTAKELKWGPMERDVLKSRESEVHIIGGGVAGLSCALNLARVGLRVNIYERREQSAFAGMGFLMMPNGVESLQRLFGPDELKSLNALTVSDAQVFYLDDGELKPSRKAPLLGASIKRPPLIELLKAKCLAAGVKLHHNTQLNQLEKAGTPEAPELLKLSFEVEGGPDQRESLELKAHYVIAADGANSTLRAQLAPELQLSSPKITEFVGISRCELPSPLSAWLKDQSEVRLHKYQNLTKRQAFGWMPLSRDEYIWYAQLLYRDSLPRVDGAERQQQLLSFFEGWPEPVLSLIKSCAFTRTYRWDTCDLEPMRPCLVDGVLFMGDAAHASLTLSSQGVSSALEDSAQLAQCFQELNSAPRPGARAALSPSSWRELCERFERARTPVWERRFHEARQLQRDFLDARPYAELPVVSP